MTFEKDTQYWDTIEKIYRLEKSLDNGDPFFSNLIQRRIYEETEALVERGAKYEEIKADVGKKFEASWK